MSTLHLVRDHQTAAPAAVAADLANTFAFYCGCRKLPWMEGRFLAWLGQGFEEGTIREAITRTSWAPRPSWRYLEAIMFNAAREGCFTLFDFRERDHMAHSELPY